MAFDVLKYWFTEASRLGRRKNALQPIGWFCFVVTVPCLYIARGAGAAGQGWFLCIAATPVALFVVAYLFFMIFDRDRLQTEEFILRDRALDLIESKGGKLQISEEGLHNIVNPYSEQRKLHGPTEGGDPR